MTGSCLCGYEKFQTSHPVCKLSVGANLDLLLNLLKNCRCQLFQESEALSVLFRDEQEKAYLIFLQHMAARTQINSQARPLLLSLPCKCGLRLHTYQAYMGC